MKKLRVVTIMAVLLALASTVHRFRVEAQNRNYPGYYPYLLYGLNAAGQPVPVSVGAAGDIAVTTGAGHGFAAGMQAPRGYYPAIFYGLNSNDPMPASIDGTGALVTLNSGNAGTVGNCATVGAIAYYAATGTTIGCLSSLSYDGTKLNSTVPFSMGNGTQSTVLTLSGNSNASVPGLIGITDTGTGANLKLLSAFAAGLTTGNSYSVYWGQSAATGKAAGLTYIHDATKSALDLGFWNLPILNLFGDKSITTAGGETLDDGSGSATFPGTVTAQQFIGTGAVSGSTRAVTSATDTATARDFLILCNAGSNTVSESLPASPVSGQMIVFKKIDSSANACTLLGNGFQIDAGTSVALALQWGVTRVVYSNNAWYTM